MAALHCIALRCICMTWLHWTELHQTAELKSVVKENQLMEAAIIRVDKPRFELKLSLRKSDTMPNPEKASKQGRP